MKSVFSLFFATFPILVIAQTNIKTRQSAFLEFAGNSRSILSINYERILAKSKRNCCLITGRAGVGFERRAADSSGLTNIPLELNVLAGKEKNFFEMGLGWTASFGKDFTDRSLNSSRHYPSFYDAWLLRAGYRYMVYQSIVLRAAPLLLLVRVPEPKLQLTFGLSLGYAF